MTLRPAREPMGVRLDLSGLAYRYNTLIRNTRQAIKVLSASLIFWISLQLKQSKVAISDLENRCLLLDFGNASFFLTLFPSSVRGNRLPFLFDSVLRVLFLLSIGHSDWFSEKVACVSSTHRSKHHHGKESSLLERRFLDPRSAEERLWTMPSALKREKVSCLSRGHSWSQRFEIGC